MSASTDSSQMISEPLTHRDGIYCFIGPESYEVDKVAITCARQMKGVFVSAGIRTAFHPHSAVPIFMQLSKLKDRKIVVDQSMASGRPSVAVYVVPSPNMTFAPGIDLEKALKAAKRIAKPTPAEGWTQIYRYTKEEGIKLMWDAIKHNKQHNLVWEKE